MQFVLVISWFRVQLTINLSLIARETMQLLVNRQLIPITIQPKTISPGEQNCYKNLKVL